MTATHSGKARTWPAGPVGTVTPRRPGLRIGLILLALLGTVLVATLFIQRGFPTTTILVTDLPCNDTEIASTREKAANKDIDLVLFVAGPGRVVTTAALHPCLGIRDMELGQPEADLQKTRAMLVVSQSDAAAVREELRSTAQIADLDGKDGEIRLGPSLGRPGLLRLAIWTLALLAIGALFGRVLLPRARSAAPAAPAASGAGASVGPEHRPRASTQLPADLPPADTQGVLWPRGDVKTTPPGGVLDLRPFHRRSTVESWTPQCPYCGAFGPRATEMDGGDSHYRCARCEETWRVRSGEPWPTVVIRPRYRRPH